MASSPLQTIVIMGRLAGEPLQHMTFAFRSGLDPVEQGKFTATAMAFFAGLLPIQVKIREELILVGPNKDLPAYDIEISDAALRSELSQFWTTWQRRPAGETMWPFTPHSVIKRAGLSGKSFAIEYVEAKCLESKEIVAYVGNKP
jgi:hypothetical protein